ncbi:MAG: alpha/beta hydrolase [Bacteroidota bacterium]
MKLLKIVPIFFLVQFLTAFSFAQSAAVSAIDPSLYGSNPVAGHTINLRGFMLYYEVYGQGEPLLMIHGNGGSMNNFQNQIPYFAQHYRVILADSRAQGRSVDDSDTLSYEMMADDINALLDSLHLDSCRVIGWSDGGINGLLLAIRHPEKVKKLTITGANLWPDSSAVGGAEFKNGMDYYNSLKQMTRTPKVRNDLKLAQIIAFEPHITLQQLNHIKCPSLVIGGDHDLILPEHTMLIAKSIPGAFLWILPNSGHGTLIQYKDLFNQVVADFLK